eukprot:TRINITY_DN22329_c0_g1_i1.p1 TRINITY_DN22329_c0_g1~~TRINITY_DN22329_c0_g1_i1.p1  ORF type:complete len:380 (-),score=100.75 TRINITY_DN22329_c0_g1_i1:443-1582(-)
MTESKVTAEYRKFDSFGNVSRFTGLTVVSQVQNCASDSHWAEAFELLNSTPGFSALPPSSYHMTLCDLTTVKKQGTAGNLLHFAMQNFARLGEVMDKFDGFQPVIKEFEFAVSGLIVTLENQREALKYRHEIYDAMGLKDWPKKYQHHITLAYFTGKGGVNFVDKSLAKSVNNKLMELLGGKTIILEPAKICWFEDMTAFHPLCSTLRDVDLQEPSNSRAGYQLAIVSKVTISSWKELFKILDWNQYIWPQTDGDKLFVRIASLFSAVGQEEVEAMFCKTFSHFQALIDLKETVGKRALQLENYQVLVNPESGIELKFSFAGDSKMKSTSLSLAVFTGQVDPSEASGIALEIGDVLENAEIVFGQPTLCFIGDERMIPL